MTRPLPVLLAATLLLSCSGALAAVPAIVGSSGTWAHKETVTISGTGFGAKPTAAPLAWEDFSDCALTNTLDGHSIGTFANRDNLRTSVSPCNARADFKVGDGYNFFSYDKKTSGTWFFQYWIKLATNWRWGRTAYGGGDDGLANVKFVRLFPAGSRNTTDFGYVHHGWDDSTVRFIESTGSQGGETDLGWRLSSMSLGAWHLIQVEIRENTGADRADGVMRLWVDGQLKDSVTTARTNLSADGAAVNKRPYNIGLFDSWPPSKANVPNMYAWYSDVYVDDTWSRVELGDSPVYTSCTHREIQEPVSWSDGSIKVRVNQGSFAPGQKAYLFVVSADGSASSGYQVTMGGVSTIPPVTNTPPTTPKGVRRADTR